MANIKYITLLPEKFYFSAGCSLAFSDIISSILPGSLYASHRALRISRIHRFMLLTTNTCAIVTEGCRASPLLTGGTTKQSGFTKDPG
ncbi:MAG: hypothetical protein LBG28_03615 [Tannerella sp.]|nr:hypothetical protein [Tannerella sp.]